MHRRTGRADVPRRLRHIQPSAPGHEPTRSRTRAITTSRDPARVHKPGSEPGNVGSGATAPLRPRRLTPELRRAAAARLVSVPRSQRDRAAQRLLTNAQANGIDLELMWGTVTEGGLVRQVVLLVPGEGRIAVAFQSGPAPASECGDEAIQRAERAACLETAAREVRGCSGRDLRLVQALPEESDDWAREALDSAGWQRIGTLASLRCALPLDPAKPDDLPDGVRLDRFRGFDVPSDVEDLHTALDRSYEDTLDCPGLTGLRTTPDIIESHASVGLFDPRNWWIARHEGSPEGCVLLNRLHDHRTIELVYIGVSKRLRGRSLGRTLLPRAVRRVAGGPAEMLTCAVDTRNTPALGVYEEFGFERQSERDAYVRPLATDPSPDPREDLSRGC